MPGMTSSSTVNIRRVAQMTATRTHQQQQQQQQQATNGASCLSQQQQEAGHQGDQHSTQVKILTNFSIDSIIGQVDNNNRQLAGPQPVQRVQQQLQETFHLETTNWQQANNRFISFAREIDDLHRPHKQPTSATGDEFHYLANNAGGARKATKPGAQEVKKYRPKNFQCPVCGMAFSNNGQLKNHVRIHTGERPFRCNQSNCGKTFTRNEELTRHKLIHTGFRPHPCPNCPKRFGRKDHLKKHVRTHERKKLRKSCYVQPSNGAPGGKITKRSFTTSVVTDDGNPAMLLSPKKVRISNTNERSSPSSLVLNGSPPLTQSINGLMTNPSRALPEPQYNQYSDNLNTLPPPLPQPPVTFAPAPQQFIDPNTARTMAAIASSTSLNMLSTSTSGPLQQLAGDYWQKWYDFLGFYQQP